MDGIVGETRFSHPQERSDMAFNRIEMFECEYCKKIFRTQRHKCIYDILNKNCLSCKNCIDFDDFEGQYGEYHRCELEPYKAFVCKVNEESINIEELRKCKWNFQCEKYETLDNYKGKPSYMENLRKHWGSKLKEDMNGNKQ